MSRPHSIPAPLLLPPLLLHHLPRSGGRARLSGDATVVLLRKKTQKTVFSTPLPHPNLPMELGDPRDRRNKRKRKKGRRINPISLPPFLSPLEGKKSFGFSTIISFQVNSLLSLLLPRSEPTLYLSPPYSFFPSSSSFPLLLHLDFGELLRFVF